MTMTMIQDRIDALQQREADRVKHDFAAYRELVTLSLDGVDIDPARAAEILNDTGKSCADLEADVQTLERRRGWRQTLDTEAAIAEEATVVEREIGRLRSERQKAVEVLDRQISVACTMRASLVDRQSSVGAARNQLIQTAPKELEGFEAELRHQLRGLGSERQLAVIEQSRLRQQRDNLARLRDNENNSKNPLHVNDSQRQHYADSVRHIEQTIAGQDRHLQELAAAAAELQAQLDEILERKLTP